MEHIPVRPFRPEDAAFRARVVGRLNHGPTISPRDPAAMADWLARYGRGDLPAPEGAEVFVAEAAGEPLGLLQIHPETDYFTGHPRAYVDVLVVAAKAEGRGVGAALMRHAEAWARGHGCHEVCLDVFAGNARAIGFYERLGDRPDHLRLAKPVAPPSAATPPAPRTASSG